MKRGVLIYLLGRPKTVCNFHRNMPCVTDQESKAYTN